jgi:hypothetical protein
MSISNTTKRVKEIRREGINSNPHDLWSKNFLEAIKKRLVGDIMR